MMLAKLDTRGIHTIECAFIPSFLCWRYKTAIVWLTIRCDGQLIYAMNPTKQMRGFALAGKRRSSFFYLRFADLTIQKQCTLEVHYRRSKPMTIYHVQTHAHRVDLIPDAI